MNTKDDRTDVFGIPYKPPERDEAVAQYQRRSMHKLHIAEWHRAEFERLEGELTTTDFVDFDTERFLPAQAHADGAIIQLAAGFDAFACAVAHHYGLENPDRASLWEMKWVAGLVEAAEHDLRAILQSVVEDPNFAELKFYRNLAAHRGVIGEQQRGGEVEEVGVDGVRFMLPDWLPMEAPDHPSYSVRPILRKYLEWGRPALAGLNAVASAVWVPVEHESEELVCHGRDVRGRPTHRARGDGARFASSAHTPGSRPTDWRVASLVRVGQSQLRRRIDSPAGVVLAAGRG